MRTRNWLLPEHIEDVLPEEARRIERLRGLLLEAYRVHGYELVIPPLLEYVESLLTGTGRDLDLRTFKLVDQVSGRMMGLRADITPQVARIDAHLLNREGVTRLAYCGSVLHTRPAGLTATREPILVGAEIYGHAGIESDIEIQRLLATSLQLCGVLDARLDLGHVGIFGAISKYGAISASVEADLFEVLQAKDVPALAALTASLDPVTREALRLLPDLYGGVDVLDRADRELPGYPEIKAAIADLRALTVTNGIPITVDLADLRGYHYHSGVVFAAYCPGLPNAIALGGRYDEVGKAFGRARPATGFSIYMREVVRVLPSTPERGGVLAPCSADVSLVAEIARLRQSGEVVIADLPGHAATVRELGCDRRLILAGGKWHVEKITES
jgi:ATP phosphoribosyltransferase regulatory subunit